MMNEPKHYVLEDGTNSMAHIASLLGKEHYIGFLKGNAMKYITRYEKKNGVDDLKKALDYVERLIEVEENE